MEVDVSGTTPLRYAWTAGNDQASIRSSCPVRRGLEKGLRGLPSNCQSVQACWRCKQLEPSLMKKSSYLKHISYDPKTKIMDVVFQDGAEVRYFNVNPKTVAAIVGA